MKKSINDIKVPLSYPDRKICIMGLGFVGLTLAIAMADVGFQVTGIEIRDDLLAQLSSGDPYFFEPNLSSQLKKVMGSGALKISKTIPSDCESRVYIITVGTPLGENKQVNLSSIQKVTETIGEHLKDGDLVILRSTVKLGATRAVVIPLLKKSGKRFQVAFCPERTVEGQAMAELRYLPQIIGADTLSTGSRATRLFQYLTPTIVRVNDLETAEMIKLIDNAQRDVVFGFSNEVAHICDVAGLSADQVIAAGRFGYARTNLSVPGPVGGPCLSKDPHILIQSMKEYGIVPEITAAARKINEQYPIEVIGFLKDRLKKMGGFPKNPRIALLGIAFKGRPETDDIRGTTAIPIFEALKEAFPDATFTSYDPVVHLDVLESLGLDPEANAHEAIAKSNLVLILNNHPFFSTMPIEKWASDMAQPGVIYDFWNNFRKGNLVLPSKIKYIAFGSHQYGKK